MHDSQNYVHNLTFKNIIFNYLKLGLFQSLLNSEYWSALKYTEVATREVL